MVIANQKSTLDMQIKKGIQAQILKLVIKSQENKRGREEERPYKNKFKRI